MDGLQTAENRQTTGVGLTKPCKGDTPKIMRAIVADRPFSNKQGTAGALQAQCSGRVAVAPVLVTLRAELEDDQEARRITAPVVRLLGQCGFVSVFQLRLVRPGLARMQELNPELFSEAVAKGAGNLERGVTDFPKWSRLMEYQFGELIRPNLERIWGAAHDEWLRRRAAPPPLPPISQPEPIHSELSPSPNQSNYFVRHWRGELPLPVSYWVNGILGCLVVAILSGFVSAFDATNGLKAAVAAGIVLYLLSFTVSVWQIVGTWRSASNHAGRGGRAAWAALAKVVLVLGVVNLARLTAFSTVPQIVEFSNILAGDNKLPPYEIRVLSGGGEVEFHGGIRAGSARELERILVAVPQAKVLHVNSVGGRIREAEYMARLVRGRGLITYTSEECLSAATLVFIAGKERVVSAQAKIGFHQAWLPGMTEAQRRISDGSLRQIMRLAGVSDDFINHVVATPHESMWFPTIQEMRRAGVITSESFGERFAVSGSLLRHSSPREFDEAFRDLPGFSAIKELEPATYQRMLNEFSTAIQSGKSQAEAQKIVRRMSEQLIVKYLPAASDEALRAMRDLWVEMLERFKDKDSRACIAMFSPKSAPADFHHGRVTSDWNGTNTLVVIEKVLRSAAKGAPRQINAKAAEEDLASIHLKLQRQYGDDCELMAQEDRWMEHSHRVCEMLLSYYRETQRIPEQRQANLLRYLLSAVSRTASRPQEAVTPYETPPAVARQPQTVVTSPKAQPDPAMGPAAFPSWSAYLHAYSLAREAVDKRNEEAQLQQMLQQTLRQNARVADRPGTAIIGARVVPVGVQPPQTADQYKAWRGAQGPLTVQEANRLAEEQAREDEWQRQFMESARTEERTR